MLKISGLTKILSFFLVLSVSVKCRRYDVEEEARKLYKEDLKTVLARFRRTPDYLKILQDKAADLKEYVHDISMQILYHHNEQIKARVSEMMGVNASKSKDDTTTTQTPAFYRGRAMQNRRQGDNETDEKSGVQKLDKYNKLYSPLTLAQRNAMRDLGFEYAGRVIHTIIKSLGCEELPKSTMMPYADFGEQEKTTTEHVSVHTVSTTEQTTFLPPVTQPSGISAKEETYPNEKYHFRYQPELRTGDNLQNL